jgi:DNA-binding MarR family transcriptional regulator
MINLTDNEIAVLRSLANNHYGDEGDGVWSFAINDSDTPSGITGPSLSGVIGSLCKKGLIRSEEYDRNEDVIWMNAAGKAEIAERGLVQR